MTDEVSFKLQSTSSPTIVGASPSKEKPFLSDKTYYSNKNIIVINILFSDKNILAIKTILKKHG